MQVEKMTREERRAWLAEHVPRSDLARIIRSHVFRSSRPWPDGTPSDAPNWNPGCSCNEARDEVMYFFEWDKHLADVILSAGYTPPPADDDGADLAARLLDLRD